MEKINPGVLNQMNSSTLSMYNNLTVEKLNKALDEIFSAITEKDNLPPYGYVGGGLYHIGNGAYCNRKGFDEFEKELSEQLDTYSLRWTPKIGLKRLSNVEIRKIKSDINGK